jgi:ATP-dependent DNA helicase RecQ
VLPGPGRHIAPERLAAAAVYSRTQDVVIEPRKLWPNGTTVGLRGQIIGATTGRALRFADTPGWGEVSEVLVSPSAIVSPIILAGLVGTLARAKGTPRPAAIVVMPSRSASRRALLSQVATHLANEFGIEVIPGLEVSGPRVDADLAPARRVDALSSSLNVASAFRAPVGPVLLLDDTYRSGWTMTVAAAKLRAAGASGVLPLVLHQLP